MQCPGYSCARERDASQIVGHEDRNSVKNDIFQDRNFFALMFYLIFQRFYRWEGASVLVEGEYSTFDEPGVGVKWKMSEKVCSTSNVATQMITIARTCETVNAKMITGISDQICDGRWC